MSEQVGQYRVSRKAVDYLLERMWLTRELEGPLRDQLATDRWEHWVVASDAASVERLERFTTGWGRRTAPLPAPTVVEAMSALGPSAIWLVPHPAARPSDPFLTAYDRRYLQSEEAVYLACRDPTAEEASQRGSWLPLRPAASAWSRRWRSTTRSRWSTCTRQRVAYALSSPTPTTVKAFSATAAP